MSARPLPGRTLSLQWRIVIALQCLLAVSFAIAYTAISSTTASLLEQQITARQVAILEATKRDLDRELDQRLKALKLHATQSQKLLPGQASLDAQFNGGVFWIGVDGFELASTTPRAALISTRYADDPVVRAALDKGETTVAEPVQDTALASPVLRFGTPILGQDGAITGVLMGVVDLRKTNFLDSLIDKSSGRTDSLVLVSRASRTVVAATDLKMRLQVLEHEPLTDRFIDGFEGSGKLVKPFAQEMLATAVSLRSANWYLQVNVPAAEAMAPMLTFERERVVDSAIFMGVILILVWVIVRQQLQPMKFASGFNNLLGALDACEAKLQRSEQRYRGLAHALQVGLWVQNAQGEIVLSNQHALDLLGIDDSSLLAKVGIDPHWDVIREDGTPFPAHTHPAAIAAATGKPVHDVVMGVYRPANADRIWLTVNAEPQLNDTTGTDRHVSEVICTFVDITELRESRARLETSESFNLAVINALAETVCVLDKDGVIIAINSAWREFGIANGAPGDSAMGVGLNYLGVCGSPSGPLGIPDTTDTPDTPSPALGIQQVLHGELSNFEFEYPCHSPTQQRWFRMGVTPLRGAQRGVVVSHLDITERKVAEHAMARSEQRLQAILDVTPVPKALIDKSGNFTYVNQAFTACFGYTLDDIPTRVRWHELALPDAQYREQVLLRWITAVRSSTHTGGMTASQEIDLRCKNDTVKTVLAQTRVVPGEGVDLEVLVLYDITQLKGVQAKLESNIRDKSALLQEVHHRVKNNLQVIASLLRLESRRVQGQEGRNILGEMQSRIRSMALLHESLYRSGVFANVDLAVYLRQLATQAFRALQTEQDSTRLALDLQRVSVTMDQATPCGLLLNELLSNTLKHAFKPGTPGTVVLQLHRLDGQRVALRVSDDGVGLPADFAQRCEKSLGLQLVFDLARQMGGTFRIGNSTDGTGTQSVVEFSAPESSEASQNE